MRRRLDEGCLTVEMEAAALFAAASSQYLQQPAAKDLQLGNISVTFAGWVKLTSKPANEMNLFAQHGSAAADQQFKIYWHNGDDRFKFIIADLGPCSGSIGAARTNRRFQPRPERRLRMALAVEVRELKGADERRPSRVRRDASLHLHLVRDLHRVDREVRDAVVVSMCKLAAKNPADLGFPALPAVKLGLGGTISTGLVPSALERVYGGRANIGVGVFVTLRPAAMMMTAADPHAGHRMQ